MFNSLEEAWEDVEEQVIPANVGWAERKNLKNCFFNGAMALWNMIGLVGDMPDEEGHAFSQNLYAEMTEHIAREKAEQELDSAS